MFDKTDETPPVKKVPVIEADNTPVIHALALKANGQHTDIIASIHAPTGFLSKRKVLTGDLTAKKLAAHLVDIAKW